MEVAISFFTVVLLGFITGSAACSSELVASSVRSHTRLGSWLGVSDVLGIKESSTIISTIVGALVFGGGVWQSGNQTV
ncbi:hypothetical protein PC120_g13579 [Phytophthora cactorum]|nr:hypothetical protein PC120_g13579 [Phytophthora cactorum]